MDVSPFEIISSALVIFKVVVIFTGFGSKATRKDRNHDIEIVARSCRSTTNFDMMRETK